MDSLNAAFEAFKDWKRLIMAGTTNFNGGNFSDVLLAATTSLMRHPDDSRFSNVRELPKPASQGQIRTTAPASKPSEIQPLKSATHEYRILCQTSEERDFDGHGERRKFRYCLQRGFDYYLGNGTILPSKDADSGEIFQWLVVFYINNYPGCQTFHYWVEDCGGALRRLLKKSSGKELTEDDARVMISEA